MLLSTTINAIWLISWFQPQKKDFFLNSYIQTILSLFGFFDLYVKKKNSSISFPINERLSFESTIGKDKYSWSRNLDLTKSSWELIFKMRCFYLHQQESQRNIEVHRKKPTIGNLFHEYITRLIRGIGRVQQHKWGLVKRIK